MRQLEALLSVMRQPPSKFTSCTASLSFNPRRSSSFFGCSLFNPDMLPADVGKVLRYHRTTLCSSLIANLALCRGTATLERAGKHRLYRAEAQYSVSLSQITHLSIITYIYRKRFIFYLNISCVGHATLHRIASSSEILEEVTEEPVIRVEEPVEFPTGIP